ncbi:MAG: dienelactone hydrolase family protein [Lachnospiraceae bacterium]|nr:dienelactone hydrolase family protein [Lachnospiraceae bacterium]
MWNSFRTDAYAGQIAEVIRIRGNEQDMIRAYHARPLGAGPFPGLVLIPHMPGWDEWCRETARRFAEHGYSVVCPNIYDRVGSDTPAALAAKAREAGLPTDESVMGDTQGSIDYLRSHMQSNGKVGVIGMCSGGRHTFLAACTCEGIDAAVDCWGGGVIPDPTRPMPQRTMSAIGHAADLQCPLCGIFGNDDSSPSPDEVNRTEAVLKELGKEYEFHRYDGAGHGIWYYDRPLYRQQQAMDSFNTVLEFLDRHLKT